MNMSRLTRALEQFRADRHRAVPYIEGRDWENLEAIAKAMGEADRPLSELVWLSDQSYVDSRVDLYLAWWQGTQAGP